MFNLALEARNYTLAQQALEQLKNLPPTTEKYLQDRLNNRQADLLCAQEKYEEATAFIDPTNLFNKRVVHAIQNKRDGSKRTLLPVPFIRQKNMTCAPASMSAITHYWQQGVPQNTIIEAICYGGTQAYDERKLAELRAYHAEEAQKFQDESANFYREALEKTVGNTPINRTLAELLTEPPKSSWEEREAMARRDTHRREAQIKKQMRELVRAQMRAERKKNK